MRCPRVDQLPPPPAGRKGWPWTEGCPAIEGTRPSLTVVVPSYAQAEFLEETLRSILLQGHPDLELLVMDGGSRDGSVEIIERYAPWIAGWVSEKDGGQSNAINKGWRRAQGELVTWLNSDDLLLPGWADAMTAPFVERPALDLTYCDVQVIDRDSVAQWVFHGRSARIDELVLRWKTPFAQQGFLMRRRLLEACGYIDESLHYAMDTEYWLRVMLAGRELLHVPRVLAAFRVHEAAKTSTHHHVLVANLMEIVTRFVNAPPPGMSELAARAGKRLHWSAAHACYDGRRHTDARAHAVQHLRDDGVRALPRVAAMMGLSLLGDPGHRLLGLYRRYRERARTR